MTTVADITKLRTATGAGMMDCKNALDEAGGDMDKAAEILRKKGIVKAAKRADKIAAEGMVAGYVSADGKVGAIADVNSETDFVGQSPDFVAFAKSVAELVAKTNPKDLEALSNEKLSSGKTVAETISDMGLAVGEKIGIRRFARYESAGLVGAYMHGNKIGVLVELEGGSPAVATDIAMHVAAANPKYLNRAEVDPTDINKEKEVYAEQLKSQNKPANIIENILKGKIEKYYGEICLLEQPYIKDEEKKVEAYVKAAGATIKRFVRFELGEGIEKKVSDFAAEVAEQLK